MTGMPQRWKIFVLGMALAAAAAAQSPPPSGQSPSGPDFPGIRVDVKLVNIFATVTDANGAIIPALQKDDFAVYEDGVRQNIRVFERESELPLSIVLAIDASLSTRKDLKLELSSARNFAHGIMRPVDSIALYRFAEEVDELVPFTSDLARLDEGIAEFRVGSATALYDAVYLGSQALERRHGARGEAVRKVMVVITDGGDTFSQVSYPEAVREAQQSEAIVYSIIIVPIEASAGRNTGGEHALIQLSHDTGGKAYYADTTAQLDEVFRQISSELRTQYLLAYYPLKRLSDSDYRSLEVRVVKPSTGARVRTRAGYYTSKSH
jgi:Ca-activated chloride channel family protein